MEIMFYIKSLLPCMLYPTDSVVKPQEIQPKVGINLLPDVTVIISNEQIVENSISGDSILTGLMRAAVFFILGQ